MRDDFGFVGKKEKTENAECGMVQQWKGGSWPGALGGRCARPDLSEAVNPVAVKRVQGSRRSST